MPGIRLSLPSIPLFNALASKPSRPCLASLSRPAVGMFPFCELSIWRRGLRRGRMGIAFGGMAARDLCRLTPASTTSSQAGQGRDITVPRGWSGQGDYSQRGRGSAQSGVGALRWAAARRPSYFRCSIAIELCSRCLFMFFMSEFSRSAYQSSVCP